jgi:superfamily II DNA/RNA helicase
MPYNNKRRNRRRYTDSRTNRSSSNRRGPKKEYINPAKFIKAAKSVEQAEYVPQHSFTDFDLPPEVLKNISQKGYTSPSPIQDQIIPVGLAGRDVIGIANTGTGKTVAFALPVLKRILQNRHEQVMVIAPTRELAAQVLDEFRWLAQGRRMNWALLIGGAPMHRQIRDLKNRPQIVIGTPGRIKDHMERNTLKLNTFSMVVLDEVDRMLDMGFVNDMYAIVGAIPTNRQSFFFSATIDPRVRKLIDEFSRDPVEVSVVTGDTSDNVEQNVVRYNDDTHKMDRLHEVLRSEEVKKVLIFDETRRRVERLSDKLQRSGFNVESIHGGRSQGQRKRALQSFKSDRTNVLVATDVAARGIDVDGITHVINYATPQSYSDYVHRIGRAGRAGNRGYALTFIEHS